MLSISPLRINLEFLNLVIFSLKPLLKGRDIRRMQRHILLLMWTGSPFLQDTISSWVVIFILPINSALNPILYTLTTSFYREQVEVLLCRWQRRHILKKERKSVTSSTMFMEAPRVPTYQLPAYLQRVSLNSADPRYAWGRRELFQHFVNCML